MSFNVGGSSGSSNTQTQLDPQLKQDWTNVYNQAQQAAATPFKPYTGQLVAGFTPDQVLGQQQTVSNAYAGYPATQRGVDVATQLTNLGANPAVTAQTFPGADLSAYTNPYQSQVADQTLSELDRARQMAINGDSSTATLQGGEGAWGGARAGVADSLTNQDFANSAASALANLNQQGFNTAAGLQQADASRTLAADQTSAQYKDAGLNRELSASSLLGTLGQDQQQQALTGASAITGVGQQQQALQQQQDQAAYEQFNRALQYPLQQLQTAETPFFGAMPSDKQGSTVTNNSQGKSGSVGSAG